MDFVKQIVGIDISKSELVCKAGRIAVDQTIEILSTAKLSNDLAGFEQLVSWAKKHLAASDLDLIFVMEATGVYYESLAYYLQSRDLDVCVLLPNKVKHFGQTLKIKSKTDSLDAEVILRIGLERKLSLWKPASAQMRAIRVLTREQAEIKRKRTATKNQLHARESAFGVPGSSIDRLKEQIALLDRQLQAIETELKELVAKDKELETRIEKLQSIPGLGFNTIVSIIGETHGFALVRSSKQLVSYAGLDVVHKESGNWKGKSSISKKGNKYIRAAVYMPALASIKYNPGVKPFYERLCERKAARKIGVTAVARKLLVWMYTLWKTGDVFDPVKAMGKSPQISSLSAG